jgi:acetolactate synthase I/II/III large subunit
MDSIPLVVLTGQVPTFMIGTDAFQEADTVGITRPCTKMNWLVKDTAKAVRDRSTRPSTSPPTAARPGAVDIPKDVQFATGRLHPGRKRPADRAITSPAPRATSSRSRRWSR